MPWGPRGTIPITRESFSKRSLLSENFTLDSIMFFLGNGLLLLNGSGGV